MALVVATGKKQINTETTRIRNMKTWIIGMLVVEIMITISARHGQCFTVDMHLKKFETKAPL